MERLHLRQLCKIAYAAVASVCFLLTVSQGRAAEGCDINWDAAVGLTVNVEDSQNCGGGNPYAQLVTKSAKLSGGIQQADEGKGCPYTLAVTVEGSVELQDGGYDYVYVNDVLYFSSRGDGAGCAMLSKSETRNITVYPGDSITLTYDTVDGLYHTGGHATITNIALVKGPCNDGCDGGCTTCAPGDGGTENSSVDVRIGMGLTSLGKSAGLLRVKSDTPSLLLARPAGIQYGIGLDADVTVVRLQGVLRQIRTAVCLADIVPLTDFKYEIRFYKASQVGAQGANQIFALSGNPYAVWTLENPDASTSTASRLNVTETRDGQSKVSNYEWKDALNGWELTKAGRKETRSNSWDATNTNRTSTYTLSALNGVVAYKKAQTFHVFPWGEELVEETIDPGGAALKTTWTFYENVSDGGYGLLKQLVRPTGSWETYSYDGDGRLVKTVKQFLNSPIGSPEPQNWIVTKTYSDYVPQETEVTTLLGQEVARLYRAFYGYGAWTDEIRCQTPGAAWDASDNLTTGTEYYTSGDNQGKVRAIHYPDGTLQITDYSSNAGELTTTVSQGQANADQSGVIDGQQTVVVTNPSGKTVAEFVYDLASGLLATSQVAVSQDEFGRPTRVDFGDDTFETFSFGCCGMDAHTDRDGITTTYIYDAFKRVERQTRAGVTTVYGYDAAGNRSSVKRVGTDQTQILLESRTYDVAGRLTTQTDALGKVTNFNEGRDGAGNLIKTVVLPENLGTKVESFTQDNFILSVSGSAAHPVKYNYGVEPGNGYYRQEILVGNNNEQAEWTKTYSDLLGRDYKSTSSAGAINQNFFNNKGQLVRMVDPDGVTTLYGYNDRGEQEVVALDVNRNGVIDYAGADRITRIHSSVVDAHGKVVSREERSVWPEVGVDNAQTIAVNESVDGGRLTWHTLLGLTTATELTCNGTGTCTTTVTTPDGSRTVTVAQNGRVMSSARFDANSQQLSASTYHYDAHGRRDEDGDARTGATNFTYYDNDLLKSKTHAGLNTLYGYDAIGRRTSETLPDAGQVIYSYYPDGGLKSTSGARTYPRTNTYDSQGRLKTLTTTGATGNAVTTWNYHPQSGQLATKVHADGKGTAYTQTPAGRTLTRVWARGITTTYGYNDAGDLGTITYSDGSTPAASFIYDRLGRLATANGGGTVRSLDYQGASDLIVSDTATAGPLAGFSVATGYDTLLRRTSLIVKQNTSSLASQGFGYDAASRLQSASQGLVSVAYGYLANSTSDLTQSLTFKNGANTVLTTTKAYHPQLDRLESIASQAGSNVPSSYTYAYNAAQERVQATLADNTHWTYGYDALGQLTAASRRWADGSTLAGQQFSYAFDAIGNRIATQVNGRMATYVPNALNQYVQREVPGTVDVLGQVEPQAVVTVNNQPVTRQQAGYFYKGLTVDNSQAAADQPVDVVAVRRDAGPNAENIVGERQGRAFLPRTPESYTYDPDGNLTQDGRWTYTWDAENRLVALEARTDLPASAKRRLEFAYDDMGRRVQKRVWDWTNNAYQLSAASKFVYDGWNMVAEVNAITGSSTSYLWGLDLSRSQQGAGGIGGLLSTTKMDVGLGAISYLFTYDGNGNVTSMVSAISGLASAFYEHGPFGESIKTTGPTANINPFRFSTHYTDADTELVYAKHRFYSPSIGRWISRDPIGEDGGLNLFGYVRNNSIRKIDPFGLIDSVSVSLAEAIAAGDVGAIEAILAAGEDVLSESAIAAARAFLKKVAECEGIHAAYKALNCKGCSGCITKECALANAACLATEVALRSAYIKKGCDSCLAGSIARGSKIAQAGHQAELLSKTQALVKCTSKIGSLPSADPLTP